LKRRIFGREQDVASCFHCSEHWCQYFKSQRPSKKKKKIRRKIKALIQESVKIEVNNAAINKRY